MFLIGSCMLRRACTSDLDARQHPVLLDENMDHGLWCFVLEALPTVPASSVAPTAEEVSVRQCIVVRKAALVAPRLPTTPAVLGSIWCRLTGVGGRYHMYVNVLPSRIHAYCSRSSSGMVDLS